MGGVVAACQSSSRLDRLPPSAHSASLLRARRPAPAPALGTGSAGPGLARRWHPDRPGEPGNDRARPSQVRAGPGQPAVSFRHWGPGRGLGRWGQGEHAEAPSPWRRWAGRGTPRKKNPDPAPCPIRVPVRSYTQTQRPQPKRADLPSDPGVISSPAGVSVSLESEENYFNGCQPRLHVRMS